MNEALPARSSTAVSRIAAIDLLRGLVMIVMALDHTRDFVHDWSVDPTDPRSTTPALFFTRWITHYCAPVFVFLAGLSVHLQLQRGVPRAQLARHLVERGLFLVALELFVLRPLIWFQFDPAMLAFLQVIWAIGWSMCGLGLLLLLRLPPIVLGALGVLIVAGHNLLTHVPFSIGLASSWEALRVLLVGRGGLQFGEQMAIVQYGIVPWFGIMLLGFVSGPLYAMTPQRRCRWLLTLGCAAIGTFLLLRGLRLYGDPVAWSRTASGWRSVYSFLRVEKYPPSLHYTLMTLGPALVFLALTERVRADGLWRAIVLLGRAPLFFYVLQWPAVHLVSRLFQVIDGQPVGWDAPDFATLMNGEFPADCGFSLPVVYLAWLTCLAVLVPLSVWFARWRSRHGSQRWLRYL